MTRPNCRCGKPCQRAAKGQPRDWLPGCKTCWAAYLDGGTRDDGASALASYTPPLDRDGLLVPAESTVQWQKATHDAAARLGRKDPFRG